MATQWFHTPHITNLRPSTQESWGKTAQFHLWKKEAAHTGYFKGQASQLVPPGITIILFTLVGSHILNKLWPGAQVTVSTKGWKQIAFYPNVNET